MTKLQDFCPETIEIFLCYPSICVTPTALWAWNFISTTPNILSCVHTDQSLSVSANAVTESF